MADYTPSGHSHNLSKNQGYKPYKSRKLWVFLIGAAMVAGLGIIQGVTGWKIPAICYGTIGGMVAVYMGVNVTQKIAEKNNKQIQGSVPGE
jgi:hypothetical protein